MLHSLPMGLIDAHVHLYPPEVNDAPAAWAASKGETLWAELCTRLRPSTQLPVQGFPTVEELLRKMDQAGVERSVLQGWYWEKHETCRHQNIFYADCIHRYPERLSACATIHPHAGVDAILRELEWANDQGFCGLGELSPHSQHFPIDDAAWSCALNRAGELELPVVLHVTDPEGKNYPGRVETPLEDFISLAETHPKTTFVLAHWGGRIAQGTRWGSRVRKLRNVFFDTAASPLLYDFSVFEETILAAGKDSILFGSDYPLILFPREEAVPSVESFVARIQNLGVDHSVLKFILGENARHVFRLPGMLDDSARPISA